MFYEPFRIDISYTWKHTWYLSQMSRMSRMTLVYVYDHCQMHNRSKAFSTLTHSTPLVHSRSWHYCHIMYAFLNWTCGFFSQAVWSLEDNGATNHHHHYRQCHQLPKKSPYSCAFLVNNKIGNLACAKHRWTDGS